MQEQDKELEKKLLLAMKRLVGLAGDSADGPDHLRSEIKPTVEDPEFFNEARWRIFAKHYTSGISMERESEVMHGFRDGIVKSSMHLGQEIQTILYAYHQPSVRPDPISDREKFELAVRHKHADDAKKEFFNSAYQVMAQLETSVQAYSIMFQISPEQRQQVNLPSIDLENLKATGDMEPTKRASLVERIALRERIIIPLLRESIERLAACWHVSSEKLRSIASEVDRKVKQGRYIGEEYVRPIDPKEWQEATAPVFLSRLIPEHLWKEMQHGTRIPEDSVLKTVLRSCQHANRLGDLLELEKELGYWVQQGAPLLAGVRKLKPIADTLAQERTLATQKAKQPTLSLAETPLRAPALFEFYPAADIGAHYNQLAESLEKLQRDYNLLRAIGEEAAEKCGCLNEYRQYRRQERIFEPALGTGVAM